MLTIGQFSRVTKITVKGLRLYHEKGILIPSSIDEVTGYRYYDLSCAERARAVQDLKAMMFSLNEIKEILKDYSDEEELVNFLQNKKQNILQKIVNYKVAADSIDQIIQQEKRIKTMKNNDQKDIQVKNVPAMLIASIKWQGKYSDSGEWIGKLYKKVAFSASGKCFNLYYDEDYKEENANIETCVSIQSERKYDGIEVRELEGVECVSLVHKGPYETINETYEKLFREVEKNNWQITAPYREIYLKGPGMILKGNPANYLTEIQLPIAS